MIVCTYVIQSSLRKDYNHSYVGVAVTFLISILAAHRKFSTEVGKIVLKYQTLPTFRT